jgi:hypothetical protein
MHDVYETYATGLALSHRALERNLVRFCQLAEAGEPAPEGLGEFVALYSEFLDVHHAAEDRFVFPALRAHAAGRSTDAAHLDRWDREHHDILAVGAELRRAGAAGTVDRLAAHSRELSALLAPHAADEEAVLSAAHLAEMLPASELGALMQAMEKANRSRALAMAGFLATSLEPAEQRALMGGAPWLFRKVLLPLVGVRRMRRFGTLVHTPEVSL